MLSESLASSNMPYIANEDKDKLILELNVTTTSDLEVINFSSSDPVKVEFDDGTVGEATYPGCFCPTVTKTFSPGKYIVKFIGAVSSHFDGITIKIDSDKAHFNIMNWGKDSLSYNRINIYGVNKIYAPEPDFLAVIYTSGIFNKIPKNLFSKKTTNNGYYGSFLNCNNITEIPKDLFKNWTNLESAPSFENCKNIKSIPEDLFKYNTKLKNFYNTFSGTSITTIPENLFKYNTNATVFYCVFNNCKNLTSIPENLFSTISVINNIAYSFRDCTNLTYIPQSIIDKALAATTTHEVFSGCTSASNYNSIPNRLKTY